MCGKPDCKTISAMIFRGARRSIGAWRRPLLEPVARFDIRRAQQPDFGGIKPRTKRIVFCPRVGTMAA
jgi:hypothetical protein